MYQFLAADEAEQIECFWDAIMVGERLEGVYKIICKQHEDFYIEYKLRYELYIGMRIFKNPDLLHPNLDKIIINSPY